MTAPHNGTEHVPNFKQQSVSASPQPTNAPAKAIIEEMSRRLAAESNRCLELAVLVATQDAEIKMLRAEIESRRASDSAACDGAPDKSNHPEKTVRAKEQRK